MSKKATNWKLWGKMMLGGAAICVGGPAFTIWVTPTEEELFKRYNPELQKRSLENREKTQAEFDHFVTKLKEYSKSDRPIWAVRDEDIERQRIAQLAAKKQKDNDLKAQQEAMRKESGLGKGTPRRKVKRAPARSAADDKKLQAALKKLNVQPIQAIEEVNMFKSDGNVLHFAAPKVHAAVPANTFAIYGQGEDKELTELVPGILNQLGPDSLASLRKLAESYQNMQKEGKDGEEDDIPDLVEGENFESKVE
ncbi:nascent polypeptide-associated complex [Colletotrichum karsti]|uniref:Nascent polypeptide-associated complex subunit beta n=1 Tax=Colletotrichum karsti TaxID=1095194 RepID=A0A9P6LGX4_9PEZI|nr:nascent polypeptide-associated complex [Colletotrichum karsti]KAF9871907.1 nascent polypeptide-associated complex [Colletotrichum karsti]